jgi:hypothetical protein
MPLTGCDAIFDAAGRSVRGRADCARCCPMAGLDPVRSRAATGSSARRCSRRWSPIVVGPARRASDGFTPLRLALEPAFALKPGTGADAQQASRACLALGHCWSRGRAGRAGRRCSTGVSWWLLRGPAGRRDQWLWGGVGIGGAGAWWCCARSMQPLQKIAAESRRRADAGRLAVRGCSMSAACVGLRGAGEYAWLVLDAVAGLRARALRRRIQGAHRRRTCARSALAGARCWRGLGPADRAATTQMANTRRRCTASTGPASHGPTWRSATASAVWPMKMPPAPT